MRQSKLTVALLKAFSRSQESPLRIFNHRARWIDIYFKQVLVTDVDAFGKTQDFQTAFGEGIIATEGEQWRRQRNVLQPLFHRDRILGYGDQMISAVQRRTAQWTSGEVRDIELEMKGLTTLETKDGLPMRLQSR